MVRTTFSGREIISVLRRFGYKPASREGSHVRLRYEHPETDEVRLVDVPLHDEVKIGTLRSIADQCGARDFEAWCRWIDEHSRPFEEKDPLLGDGNDQSENPRLPVRVTGFAGSFIDNYF